MSGASAVVPMEQVSSFPASSSIDPCNPGRFHLAVLGGPVNFLEHLRARVAQGFGFLRVAERQRALRAKVRDA